MKHKKISITIACVLFAAILVVSGSLICTVRSITVKEACFTEQTAKEIATARENLAKYSGKSVFFLDKALVAKELEISPYVKVVSVDIRFPDRVEAVCVERLESFAVFDGQDYYFVAEDNFTVAKKRKNESRGDGSRLTLIDGDVVSLQEGQALPLEDELFNAAITVLKAFDDPHNQIESITVDKYNEDADIALNEWNRIHVKTKEGAIISVYEAINLTEEKARCCYQSFTLLKGEDRVNRRVVIAEGDNNRVYWE